jgi:hypothetical protein
VAGRGEAAGLTARTRARATDRELAVVAAVLAAGSEKVAAHRLGLSHSTVKHHLANAHRQIRELALDHAAGRLEDAAYLERLHGLRDAKENLERTSTDGISPERAVAWLEALSATWRAVVVPAERADPLHAIYDRITIAGRKIVSVRLTPSAYAHGFALALPEKVAVARPTGFGRADAINIRIPVERAGGALISRESA